MSSPLKRSKELQPWSRDHHHALLLCWKIRTGISKSVDIARIASYARWYYEAHLKPHFLLEETYVFPVLGTGHKHIQEVLEQHARLHAMFAQKNITEQVLMELQAALEQHIRFEERVLFPEIQLQASAGQLKIMEQAHDDAAFIDHLDDPFWI